MARFHSGLRHSVARSSRVLRAAAVVLAVTLLACGQRTSAPAPPRAFVPGPRSKTHTRRPTGTQAQVAQSGSFQGIDAAYNPVWLDIDEQPIEKLTWAHPQTFWALAASLLYGFDMWRILHLIPPTAVEAVCASVIFVGLYASRIEEVPKMNKHYQVSFYASVGWTIYAIASLLHAMSHSPNPIMPQGTADMLHGGAAIVYLGSCIYFYSYHWGRQIRHLQEGRFRPWFAAGLASLTFAHGLTVGHIYKMFDDPEWYNVVQKIYPDQWQWIADTRLLELYLTAFALFLVILHLRGVVTGTKNAAIVFVGTVVAPTAALFAETFYIKAVPWQHYFMYGPKHW